MSTCPEKDIHSIYLDAELPAAYIKEYEEHIKNCPECTKKLAALQKVRAAFEQDGKAIEPTAQQVQKGFECLSAQLSYTKVVKDNALAFKPSSFLRPFAAGIAAALLVAFILPIRNRAATTTESGQSTFEPIARSALVSPASTPLVVDGELNSASLAGLFEADVSSSDVSTLVPSLVSYSSATKNAEQDMFAFAYPHTVANTSHSLASYDVFTPVNVHRANTNQQAQAEEKSAFSVEFSLGSFHFKAQGSGK